MVHRKTKETWATTLGVILAVMGSAIGLGNFLRFPGLAAKYGGGTFMIPYFVAILLLGIPIAWMEWTLGRIGGQKGFHSTPGIFFILWRKSYSSYLGFLGLLVPVGIFMYYIVIESWCLYYAYLYLIGFPENISTGELFVQTAGIHQDGAILSFHNTPILIFIILSFLLNIIIIYRGLVKGIEAISKIGIPLLFLFALIILIRVLTLGTPDPEFPERNIINGLGYMWNPVKTHQTFWNSLLNADMWLAAAGQIFFSLSVGFGVIITYASYLKKKDDVILSATTSASGNIFAEVVLGGLITIPAAVVFLGVQGIPDSTFQLGFITLPNVFEKMPIGNFFGFIWFFLFFIAALTSSISMLQPAIAFFEEGLNTTRRVSVAILSFIAVIGVMIVIYFTKDLVALDIMDFWIGTFGIFLLASIQVYVIGWVLGPEQLFEDANKSSIIQLPHFYQFIIKYITPLYLLVIFLSWLYQNLPSYVDVLHKNLNARFTFLFIILFSAFLIFLVSLAKKNWEK